MMCEIKEREKDLYYRVLFASVSIQIAFGSFLISQKYGSTDSLLEAFTGVIGGIMLLLSPILILIVMVRIISAVKAGVKNIGVLIGCWFVLLFLSAITFSQHVPIYVPFLFLGPLVLLPFLRLIYIYKKGSKGENS